MCIFKIPANNVLLPNVVLQVTLKRLLKDCSITYNAKVGLVGKDFSFYSLKPVWCYALDLFLTSANDTPMCC